MQTQAVYDETPDQLKLVAIGEQAIETLKKTFEVHMAIARGFATGIEYAHLVARTDDPSDRFYQKALSGWLDRHPKYRAFNKPYRHWAVRCLDHEAEILKWRADQGDKELAKFHYPETVFKRWAKANRPELLTDKQRGKSSAGELKPPTVSKRDQAIIDLRQEIETLSREMEELRAEKERLEQLRELENQHNHERHEESGLDPPSWNGFSDTLLEQSPGTLAQSLFAKKPDWAIATARAILELNNQTDAVQDAPAPASSERREWDFETIALGETRSYPHPPAATASAVRSHERRYGGKFKTHKVDDTTTEVTRVAHRPLHGIRRRDRSEAGAPGSEGGEPGTPLQNPSEVSTEETRDDAAVGARRTEPIPGFGAPARETPGP